MGRKRVSQETKNEIIGMMKAGKGPTEIGRLLKISTNCASQTIKKYKLNGNVKDLKRSGRPRKTSVHCDRLIFKLARQDPRASAKKIAQNINPTLENQISSRTVNNRLLERDLISYAATKKPRLNRQDKINRLNFCNKILNFTQKELEKMVFSDESNYQVINRKCKVLVRRLKNEKYSDRMVVPRLQGGGGSIGIWGCISIHGAGLCSLYQGRLNARRYIEILENNLIPSRDLFFGETSDWQFQQDNAPCHTAKAVSKWFNENQISPLIWPARSPDLNPIENIWAWMDKKLTETRITNLADLEKRLNEIWDSITVDYCRNLFNSIFTRCKLCIKNKGGHIPY